MHLAILFVFMTVHGGATLTTQEFSSMAQCEYVSRHILKTSTNVAGAWCVYK